MTKPFQHIFCATDLDPVTDHRAVDHHDRKLELARSDKLCLGARATGVLAHNKVDHVRLHQQPITFSRKRPAIDDKVVGGQAWGRSRRVNKAQQVVMLRLCGKGFHMHSAQREQDAARRARKFGHRSGSVSNACPAIARPGLPCGSGQGDMGNPGNPRGLYGMCAHSRGKGMRRIDQMRDAMVLEIGHKPRHPTKAADADRHRLWPRVVGPARVAECRRNLRCRKQARQCARFGCSAKQENIRHG